VKKRRWSYATHFRKEDILREMCKVSSRMEALCKVRMDTKERIERAKDVLEDVVAPVLLRKSQNHAQACTDVLMAGLTVRAYQASALIQEAALRRCYWRYQELQKSLVDIAMEEGRSPPPVYTGFNYCAQCEELTWLAGPKVERQFFTVFDGEHSARVSVVHTTADGAVGTPLMEIAAPDRLSPEEAAFLKMEAIRLMDRAAGRFTAPPVSR
jgi:hypothetical protein